VAEKTVYNYFPTKEDLFYSRLEAFEEKLLDALRDRPAGQTVVEAFRSFMLAQRGLQAKLDAEAARAARDELRTVTRIITESPALLAREQQVFDRYTESLARLLAVETGARADDVEPWVTAHALVGVHRTLIHFVRRRVLAGDDERERLARDLRAQTNKAFARLEQGWEGYAPAKRGSRLTEGSAAAP
jgi:AcrR family transcriptional regulator